MHNRFVPIPEFPNYLINDEGKIWSKERLDNSGHKRCGRFLKPILQHKGYMVVGLGEKGVRSQEQIHRLVLETFVGPCPQNYITRHLNGIPTDNRLINLVWGTPSENQHDSVKHGTNNWTKVGEKHPASKYSDKFVKSVIKLYQTGCYTQQEIANNFGISQVTVSDWFNGRRHKLKYKGEK